MKSYYKNKNILITGGTKGIGLATLKKFISLGSNVIYTYRKKDSSFNKLSNLSKKISSKLIGINYDSTKLLNIKKLSKIINKEFNHLDFLINNVGGPIKRSSFIKSDNKLWLDTINLNLMSSVNNIRAMHNFLIKSKNPVIINISSIASRTGGGGDSLHYSVSKSALNSLTYGLAKELKKIRVLSVAPSAIDTQFQKKFSSKKRIDKIISNTPAGRIGKPEEVANLIALLCNNEVSYLTGETIFFTGGR